MMNNVKRLLNEWLIDLAISHFLRVLSNRDNKKKFIEMMRKEYAVPLLDNDQYDLMCSKIYEIFASIVNSHVKTDIK